MQTAVAGEGASQHGHVVTINVQVRYPSAKEPFKDPHADPHETVGALRLRAMEAFGVKDETNPDGSTTTYELYHDDVKLTNLSQQIGDLAGADHALKLRMTKVIIQGRGM
jgi:hypothetical protein